MTITESRPRDFVALTEPAELLIKEARAASRRRRLRFITVLVAVVAVALTGILAAGTRGPAKPLGTADKSNPKAAAGAKSSVYPATLKMRKGLFDEAPDPALPWGTLIPASQSQWIEFKSSGTIDEWGVWRPNGDGGLLPVRSTDGGVRWLAAGPQLATDWAGGGIYYVNRVFPVGSSSVVMVSNAVIDVTTDAGRHWYQYLNAASDWVISAQSVNGGVGLRIRGFPDGKFTKRGYTVYVLNNVHHEWVRTGQSIG